MSPGRDRDLHDLLAPLDPQHDVAGAAGDNLTEAGERAGLNLAAPQQQVTSPQPGGLGRARDPEFARDRAKLDALAAEIGSTTGEPAQAAAADLVVLSVPWGVIDAALAQAGPLAGRIVIDTTNEFGRGAAAGRSGGTSARRNADRMPGARYTKCFNTLTAGFQDATATRTGDGRVVQWIAGDDAAAKGTVAELVEACGYLPVDLAGIDDCGVMEAPRRPGAVYGEEYRKAEAAGVVAAVRAGRPIPPTPSY